MEAKEKNMIRKIIQYDNGEGETQTIKVKAQNKSVVIGKYGKDGFIIEFKRMREDAEKANCFYLNPKKNLSITTLSISKESMENMIVAYLKMHGKEAFEIKKV